LSAERIADVLRDEWAITGSISALQSERDQNWKIRCDDRGWVVAKVANRADDGSLIDLQRQMMSRLCAAGIPSPAPVATTSGAWTVTVDGHHMWVVDFLPGTMLANVEPGPELLGDLGATVGAAAVVLAGFDHPAAHRRLQWDLGQAAEVFDAYLADIADPSHRALMTRLAPRLTAHTLTALHHEVHGIIHNDANDYNVLVDGQRISALLDFGDAVYAPLINDLAIACAYAMLDRPDPAATREAIVSGYELHRRLPVSEAALLSDLIRTRLAVSVCISAHQRKAAPGNAYLSVSEDAAWRLLYRLEEGER
jgi:Ser/Thr protein kinase RdoA (MazF antagonist)